MNYFLKLFNEGHEILVHFDMLNNKDQNYTVSILEFNIVVGL